MNIKLKNLKKLFQSENFQEYLYIKSKIYSDFENLDLENKKENKEYNILVDKIKNIREKLTNDNYVFKYLKISPVDMGEDILFSVKLNKSMIVSEENRKMLYENEELKVLRTAIFSYNKKNKNYNLIALGWEKFFNLGEKENNTEKEIEDIKMKLEKNHFEIREKLDGFMGIIYSFKDNIYISLKDFNNKNEFIYEKIQKMLKTKLDNSPLTKREELNKFLKNNTIIVEIISPETRIITKYNDEDLYITGIKNFEFNPNDFVLKVKDYKYNEMEEIAKKYNFKITKKYNYNFNQLLSIKSKKTKNIKEGFVMFIFDKENPDYAHKVKIKYDYYIMMLKLTKFNIVKILNILISMNKKEETYKKLNDIKNNYEEIYYMIMKEIYEIANLKNLKENEFIEKILEKIENEKIHIKEKNNFVFNCLNNLKVENIVKKIKSLYRKLNKENYIENINKVFELNLV